MSKIRFKINGVRYEVDGHFGPDVSLNEYIRNVADLRGTKAMCHEGGCGACIVVVRAPVPPSNDIKVLSVNSCLVSVLSCHGWEVTTVEGLGNRTAGYHAIQKRLASFNGTQCGYCTPGWICSMYSLCESKKNLTTKEIENSFAGNICRCTGYRPIADAFKTFATDADENLLKKLVDLEDLDMFKSCGVKCSKKCLHKDICGKKFKDATEEKNNFDDDIKESCHESHETNVTDEETDSWCVIEDNTMIVVDCGACKWFKPYKLDDVFKAMGRGADYKLIAGNTGQGVYHVTDYPQIIVDIFNVVELKGYQMDVNLILGAGMPLNEMMEVFLKLAADDQDFSYLKQFYEHMDLVAHIPVRNIGTIGGNLYMKHVHNDFQSDLFLLFETVGAMVTIAESPTKKTALLLTDFLKLDMKGKIIVNVMLPPLSQSYHVKTYKGSGKDNTTVLGCISAAGDLLPPLIIFKAQNLWSSWKGTNDIPGTTYACSESGWMMATIFNEWFEKFCQAVTERPLLVIFDGHATHLDPATIKLAVRENVAILKLPPHTTDILQPMDRCCFGPIKYKWNERLIEWQRLNQRPLNKSEFSDLLGEVWRNCLSKEVIQKSFEVTGLFPVNKEAYPKDRLDPVKLERFNKIKSSTGSVPKPLNIFEESPVENRGGRDSPSVLGAETSSAPVNQNIEQETPGSVPKPLNISEELQIENRGGPGSPSVLEAETSSAPVNQDIERATSSTTSSTEIDKNFQPELRLGTTNSHKIPNSEASSSFENLQPGLKLTRTPPSDSYNIPNPEASCSFENLQPGLRLIATPPSDSYNIPNPEASCSFANLQPGLRTMATPPSDSHNIHNPGQTCSFETLLLSKIRYTKPTTGKRRKIDGEGKLLTSEEYLKSIENLEATRKIAKKNGQKKKEPKKKKQKPKTTKRMSDTDTDIGEDEINPKKKKQKPKTTKRMSDTDTNIIEDEIKPKKKKQKPKTTKRISDTDTDIEEDEIHYDDESDLENVDLGKLIEENLDQEHNESDQEETNGIIEKREAAGQQTKSVTVETNGPKKIQMDDLDYGVGDFVLLVHKTKKGKSYYIAQIEGSDDNDNLSVIYLKRAKKIFFLYPDTRIIYSICKNEIVMKLLSPKKEGKRGALMFDIDLEKYNVN